MRRPSTGAASANGLAARLSGRDLSRIGLFASSFWGTDGLLVGKYVDGASGDSVYCESLNNLRLMCCKCL